jgi:hypothetical protein
MTFEELQQQWKTQDAKLETIIHLNVAQLSATHLSSMTSALDRIRRTLWIELAINAVALLMLGSFIGDHLREPRFLIPAAVLHLCAIALFGVSVRQLVELGRVDYAMPVVEVQRSLTRMRMLRIRESKWTLLLAPALWTPLFLVGMKGLLGVDAYAVFDPAWIAANIVFSLAVIPLMVWVARHVGERFSRSPLLQRLSDDLAGRSFNDAAAFAEKLARFEE